MQRGAAPNRATERQPGIHRGATRNGISLLGVSATGPRGSCHARSPFD